MHWILLIICCAAVYAGMVVKSGALMFACFLIAVLSCVTWLWLRYKTLFPAGSAVTPGGPGLSDAEMEALRAHVRARAANPLAIPDTLEKPVDAAAIRDASERVAAREAELLRLRQEAERTALALRAAEERELLEAARAKLAEDEAAARVAAAKPAVLPESRIDDSATATPAADAPPNPAPAAPTRPAGPEREVGEVWNPYAGVVVAPKKEVLVHPTSGDAHRDA